MFFHFLFTFKEAISNYCFKGAKLLKHTVIIILKAELKHLIDDDDGGMKNDISNFVGAQCPIERVLMPLSFVAESVRCSSSLCIIVLSVQLSICLSICIHVFPFLALSSLSLTVAKHALIL